VVGMIRRLGIPCGIVLSCAWSGDDEAEELCRREGVPVLLTIPPDTEIARLHARGIPFITSMPAWQPAFASLLGRIREAVIAGSR
jgi:MinD superfamily P-loop ATPase